MDNEHLVVKERPELRPACRCGAASELVEHRLTRRQHRRCVLCLKSVELCDCQALDLVHCEHCGQLIERRDPRHGYTVQIGGPHHCSKR